MKEITITQIYELSVSYTVEVEDDMTEPEAIDEFGEMVVNVVVNPLEDERDGTAMNFVGVDSLFANLLEHQKIQIYNLNTLGLQNSIGASYSARNK